ncbi:MAG TPA: flagellar protein FlgN [Dissulfurispiraceae bacterium]|nr:flagellar protein FlgN [Dissulfurispiraceae bacterium]
MPLYDELIGVLEKEFELCILLVGLLQKERDVIVGLDPAALELLLREKETIVAGIRLCDESRERVLVSLGFAGRTISDVAQLADNNYRERLTGLASKFKAIVVSIAELNRFNGVLIDKSLQYVKTSYNFLDSLGIQPKRQLSVEA